MTAQMPDIRPECARQKRERWDTHDGAASLFIVDSNAGGECQPRRPSVSL
jgi:hypothetical protein